MLRHAFLVLVFGAGFAFAEEELRQEPSQSIVIEGRDLKTYADGGEFSSSPMTSGKIARAETLRRFIWRHWSEKTRAYARLTRSGIDNTVTTHLFVERDESGAWRVACRSINASYPDPEWNRWFLSDTAFATSVHWVATKRGKKLVLKARGGKRILEL